jgi:hypothetical protein
MRYKDGLLYHFLHCYLILEFYYPLNICICTNMPKLLTQNRIHPNLWTYTPQYVTPLSNLHIQMGQIPCTGILLTPFSLQTPTFHHTILYTPPSRSRTFSCYTMSANFILILTSTFVSISKISLSYPCNRPWRSIGFVDVEAPTSSLDSRLTDGGEVVSLMRRQTALYPPGRFLVLISVRSWVHPRDIVRLEGLDKLQKKSTSSGLEPTTFWLVA